VPDNIKDALDIRPVRWIDEVLDVSLVDTSSTSSEESRADEASTSSAMISTH